MTKIVFRFIVIGLLMAVFADRALAQTAPAGADAIKPTYRVINLMPLFFQFWDGTQGLDKAARAKKFREDVVEPNKTLYLAFEGRAEDETFLAAYLDGIAPLIPALRHYGDGLTANLGDYQKSFQNRFPDMGWKGDVYFLPRWASSMCAFKR